MPTSRRRDGSSDAFEDAVRAAIAEALGHRELAFTDAELQSLLGEATTATASAIVDDLTQRSPAALIHWAADRAAFETRLRDPWGTAFDRYECLLEATREAGELFAARHLGDPRSEVAPLVVALVRLHARAVLVAEEILVLLRSGHASGAMARWRTLHEVAVVMALLNRHGSGLAERYLLHDAVASWRALRDFQDFADRLGQTPFDDAEVAEIQAERDALVGRYGEGYGSEYGWAAGAVGKSQPTFRDIEAEAELAHWRPFTRWASQYVHAGPRALFYVLGADDEARIILSGASNRHLADPGCQAALSLGLATVELLVSSSRGEEVVTMQVVMTLVRDTEAAFSDADEALERRINETVPASPPQRTRPRTRAGWARQPAGGAAQRSRRGRRPR